MKAMVIYDSLHGNTAKVAQAIADGIGGALATPDAVIDAVDVHSTAEADPDQLADLDLLVFGAPTHAFRASEPARGFMKRIPKKALRGVKVAAFDTRATEEQLRSHGLLSKLVDVFGYAAEPISEKLEKLGGQVVIPPAGFTVEDTEGPLSEGELERATAWGRQILARITH